MGSVSSHGARSPVDSDGELEMSAITKYLASIGAKGGKATSKAKSKAAKANGKLGGRPKKTPKGKGRTSSGSNA